MGLKFFNKDTYESLGDAFKAIKQELLSLCPKDSSSVRWQRGADGMSAVAKTGQSAADEGGDVPEESTSQSSRYNGYFTLKDVSTYNEDGTVKEYRVAVCDGETWDPEKLTSGSMPVGVNDDYAAVRFESCVFSIPENTYTNIEICVIDKDYDISRDFYTSKIYDISTLGYGNYAICIVVVPNVNVPNAFARYLIGEYNRYDSNKVIQRHVAGMGNGIPRIWLAYGICHMEVDDDNIVEN